MLSKPAMWVKVKAAYDLQRLSDLQNILLYLDDSNKEKLILISGDEKVERIKHLENQVINLKFKIDQLKRSFPFSIEESILDDDYRIAEFRMK